jgi:hypothetical protein
MPDFYETADELESRRKKIKEAEMETENRWHG